MTARIGLVLILLLCTGDAAFGDSPLRGQSHAAQAPLTLADCYRLALAQSETIAIHRELIEETEARFTRALSGILPRASFSSSDKRQDGTGASAFTLRHVPERKFVFSQPLFSGFREFAAMTGSKAERRQRTHERTRAEHLLLMDVADAFCLLLEQREDLAALEMIRAVLLERIEELAARERLGRSRSSEVLSAEAQRLRVEAELELIRNRETVARQLLEFLTGLDRIEAIHDPDPALPVPGPEAQYLAQAASRPDVLASDEARRVADKEVAIAKADFWPTVKADGNYWVERVGAAKDVSWDAAVTVEVPIFQGGQTRGTAQEAASQARQAALRAAEARRRAVLDIRDAYATLQASAARTAALAKALEVSDEHYRVQAEENRRSLVSNLEVLQALQALENARRDFLHAWYEAKRASWRLRVATGEGL